jgi:hypothetical protein
VQMVFCDAMNKHGPRATCTKLLPAPLQQDYLDVVLDPQCFSRLTTLMCNIPTCIILVIKKRLGQVEGADSCAFISHRPGLMEAIDLHVKSEYVVSSLQKSALG